MTRVPHYLPLGRWCHPSSDVYRVSCDQARKVMWNLYDHGFTTMEPKKDEKEMTRDPITVLLLSD